jgi:hypothetical protein
VAAKRLTPPPKIPNAKPGGKFLASIFWDQDIIFLIDYLPKGQTLNTEYYTSLLVQLKDILKEKSHGEVTKLFLFLHDNIPAFRALATQKKLGVQCLEHPPLFSESGPVGILPDPWPEKAIEICHFSS